MRAGRRRGRARAGAAMLAGAVVAASAVHLTAAAIAVAGSEVARVTYFDAAQVDAAFAKGAVLVGPEGGNYMVHASRREAAGQAEVHTKDTDIIYVLGGEATFVTGGNVVGGKPTAQDEVRGVSIEGGQTRRIKKGDVVIVPAGTPHWFQDVSPPVLYYVVKVR